MTKSVLFIDAFCGEGSGSYVVSRDLAKGLPEFGWRVLTTSHAEGPGGRALDIVRTAIARRRDYALAHISVYSGRAFLWAEMAAQAVMRTAHPFVLTLHGGRLPEFAASWPGRVRRLLGAARAVTCPSLYLRGEMASYCDHILEFPNPLNLGAYIFRPRTSPEPRLIWLRAFHEIYRPEHAVRVLAQVRRTYSNATLTMIGPDKNDGSLNRTVKLAGQLGVTDALQITGAVPKSKVPELLDRGDIFLNTSAVDNTPLSVLEAMASGLCVVSTNAGGLAHLLTSGEDSITSPVDDPAQMAESVLRLLADPSTAAMVSCRGRQKALCYDIRRILPRWDDLLERTAAGKA